MNDLLLGFVLGIALIPLARMARNVLYEILGLRYSPWSLEYACLCSHKAARHGGTSPPADPRTGVRPYEDVFGACMECGCAAMAPAMRFYPDRPPVRLSELSTPSDAR